MLNRLSFVASLALATGCGASGSSVDLAAATGPDGQAIDQFMVDSAAPSDMAIVELSEPDLVATPDLAEPPCPSPRAAKQFSLQPAAEYAAGSAPGTVTLGDLDGDGIADLATTNFGRCGRNGCSARDITVLLNQGKGTFAAPVHYLDNVGSPGSIAFGDVNGDKKADLAVTTLNGGATTVSVLLNNGKGAFANPVNYAAGTGGGSVAIADVNGDLKADLVVNNSGNNNVSVYLNKGNGIFGAPVNYPTCVDPRSVAIGDLNGDGSPDLVVPCYAGNSVGVLMNRGNGTFAPVASYDAALDAYPSFVALGDLNGDCRTDLTLANTNKRSVSVLLNQGNGAFAASVQYDIAMPPTSVAVGDLNGDGRADLAVAYGGVGSVNVLLGKGDGTFAAALAFNGPGGASLGSGSVIALGDLNGDGQADLALANASDDTVSVFLNDSK